MMTVDIKLKDACSLEGNIDSTFKSRYITLPRKFPEVKVMVFPLVVYGYAKDCKEGRMLKN